MNPVSMLESTYIHAQGIGRATERRLWEAGAWDWRTFLAQPDHWPLSLAQRALLVSTLEESVERLDAEDFSWFARRLPLSEHWRAVPAFGHRLAFVDIETNGGNSADDLTVVGIYDGHTMRQFVQGQNLEQVPAALENAAMLVTFYGTGFDIPFLKRAYRDMELPQLHVDLCFLLRSLGFRGGLKRIEPLFGLRRPGETEGLSGLDAVRLWYAYINGDRKALRTLLAYNAEDVKNLAVLLAEGYRRMTDRILADLPT